MGQHALDQHNVGFMNHGVAAKVAFPLGAFFGQDMAQMRAFTLVSARTGALETLRGSAIAFLLVRHSVFSCRTQQRESPHRQTASWMMRPVR